MENIPSVFENLRRYAPLNCQISDRQEDLENRNS